MLKVANSTVHPTDHLILDTSCQLIPKNEKKSRLI